MYCNYEIGKKDLILIMVSVLAISMKPVKTLIIYSTTFTMVSLITEPTINFLENLFMMELAYITAK